MKKIIARWICCCLLPMLLTGCAAPSVVKIGEQTDSLPSSAYLPVPQLPTCEEVTLTAEKGVYPAGAQAVRCTLSNKAGQEIYYGVDYVLEQKENGVWEEIPLREDYAWTSQLMVHPAKSESVKDFGLSPFLERLEPGEYRISKGFYFQKGANSTRKDYRASAEFQVE